MSSRPKDTSPDAWRTRQGILARMSPEARLQVALDLSDSVREIRIAGIISRNPGWTRTDAVRELIRQDTGVDLSQVS